MAGDGDGDGDGDRDSQSDSDTAADGEAPGHDNGDGNVDSSGGVTMQPSPTTVPCGAETCTLGGGGFGGLVGLAAPCCVDEASGTCGMSAMGSPCMEPTPPPNSDPRCPSIDVGGFIQLTSCCTEDGLCGINAAQFGAGGCVDLAGAAAMSSQQFPIDFPEPRHCDDPEADTDAGIDAEEDAGA